MQIAIHQPDLLPYSGFWFKMATSDAFIVSRHDQFQKHGYQRRVMMRETWVSHQLVGKPALVPITDVEVREGWQGRLADAIAGRYRGTAHWRDRGEELVARIRALESATRLDDVNLSLLRLLREVLGITTPLLFTDPPRHTGLERLVEQVHAVGGDAYLSGTGAHAYLGDDAPHRFAEAGIDFRWSDHAMTTGDSIVSVLMDADDPLEVVLRRREG